MLKKPVDVEINLNKKPAFNINYNQDITPYGPSVKLEKAKITENVSIPKAVDKVVSDDDLKAKNAMNYLYDKGYDEHFLTKVISAGNLGVKQERKLVPTRWSITATDDMIGKKLIDEVNDFSMIQDYSIHFGGYLGNNYLIAFFPDSWSYELFENYIGDPKNPDPSVFETGTDFEGYYGRKTYATNTVGGYYATRLAILEHLKRNKRKSTVLALRFITDEYWMPLGVWVVREATRKALANKPLKLNSKEEVLRYIELFIRRKFSFKFDDIKSKSKLIKNLMMQKKLFEF
jgi:hypothetical protein